MTINYLRMFSRGVGSLNSRFVNNFRCRSLTQQNQFRLGEIKDGKIIETVFPHKTHALNIKGRSPPNKVVSQI